MNSQSNPILFIFNVNFLIYLKKHLSDLRLVIILVNLRTSSETEQKKI